MNEVDKYISNFSDDVKEKLIDIRALIKKSAPESVESIAYGMPAYKTKGKPLVYFAGYKNHIGFYATPTGHKEFASELAIYKQGKGSVQFPITQELPVDLIIRILEFRVQENLSK